MQRPPGGTGGKALMTAMVAANYAGSSLRSCTSAASWAHVPCLSESRFIPSVLLETGEKGARLGKAVGAGDGRVAARRRAKQIDRRVAESATLRGGVEHAIGWGGQRHQLDVACRRCGRARFAPILLRRNPVVCTRLADAIILGEKFRKLDPRADVELAKFL